MAAAFAGELRAAEPADFSCEADVPAAASAILARHRASLGDVSTLPKSTDGVKTLLATMRRGDQDIRMLLTRLMGRCGLRPESESMRPVLSTGRTIDEIDRALLGRILKEKGWPVISVYGEEADQSAFLIAQHAARDPSFQKDVLEILAEKVRIHETSGENYALLFDRVRIAEGRPQRYGSQGECRGKQWIPKQMENPKTVDRRRAMVGLEPMAAYGRKVASLFCAGGA